MQPLSHLPVLIAGFHNPQPGNLFHQSLQKTLRVLCLAALLTGSIPELGLAAIPTFGQPGRHGTQGRSGRDGISAPEQTIRVGKQPQTVELIGTDGEAGESGMSGEHAAQCQQPRNIESNICGAKGGNGGNGGQGGNGGRGGNVTLYFDQLTDLQNLVLRNRGGRAGMGGMGGQAGEGCNCTEPRWTVRYCTWALMSQALNTSDAPWTEVRRETFRCSGDAFYDEQRYRPDPPRSSSTHRYGWKYIGRSRQSSFTCDPGQRGQVGRKGADGQAGAYGAVWLVPGDRIPQEQVTYRDRVSRLTQQPISLLKNNWLEKTGLQSLLGPGSDVPNSYRRLETVQGSFKVTWKAAKLPQDLGDPEIEGTITAAGELQMAVPGTLEYTLTRQPQQTQVTITGGIHPDRLKKFKLQGFDRFRDPRNFTLLDEGNLLPDLKAAQITIELHKNGAKASEVSYALTPAGQSSPGLTVWGNLYKVSLGDRFDPWLQAEEPVQYIISIQQTTRGGVTYTSGMTINLIVDRVTPNPEVQYFL